MKLSTTERKSKMFWVLENTGVRYLQCWECNGGEDSWWCPKAGFSGNTKHHFFATEAAALKKHISNLSLEKAGVEKLLNKAVKRLSVL